MLKAHVFPNCKTMIRIIWFCIVFIAYTSSMHETLIIMLIFNGLRNTGFDVDVIVGLGCCCMHT